MKLSFFRIALLFTFVLSELISQPAAQPAAQVQRIPQFENDDVKVWKAVIMPNAPLTMHTHQHARVIVALEGGTMKIVSENGSSETQKWETGKAYWLSAEEGKKPHADANDGTKPIEVMVVEIKNAKL
jgi:hypothetical protein